MVHNFVMTVSFNATSINALWDDERDTSQNIVLTNYKNVFFLFWPAITIKNYDKRLGMHMQKKIIYIYIFALIYTKQ